MVELLLLVAAAGCGSTDTSTAPEGPRLLATDTIELSIRRLDGGSGEALVSTGIPLPPGYLAEGESENVVVLIDGSEQSLYVEPLASKHPDGTLRSVLVQFRYAVNQGSPVAGMLLVGPDVRRQAPDLEKTTVTWSVPPAAALPTSAEYLTKTLLVGPSVTVADLPAGFFRQWETDFESSGETRWSSDDLGEIDMHQYDRALVWFAGWVRSGNPVYWERGSVTAGEYWRISDPHYSWQPHFQEVQGLDVHYLVTGDERARTAVREMATFMDEAYGDYIDKDPTREWMDSRIQTRVLLPAMVAARLEVGGADWDAVARRDLDQILGTQSSDGAMRWEAWDNEHAVFMASLLIHAMIEYYTWFEADERIPPFIKRILDFVHPALWTGDSWQYTSAEAEATVDLNQLNAIGYAWYGWYSGEEAYSAIARTAFEQGVIDAYLGYKQFNQNYRGSFQTAYYLTTTRP